MMSGWMEGKKEKKGGKGERGISWETGIDIYMLLYSIKQITDKNLLYSTGNSFQYSVMVYMGK